MDNKERKKLRNNFLTTIKRNEDIRTQFDAFIREKPNEYESLKQKLSKKIKLMIIDEELDEQGIVKFIDDIRKGISESFYDKLKLFQRALRS